MPPVVAIASLECCEKLAGSPYGFDAILRRQSHFRLIDLALDLEPLQHSVI
jgi:hypothetical protein